MAGTPDHPITITPTQGRVKVTFGGKVVADTTKALTLQEASYPPVQYLPRADLDMSLLTRTANATHCPYTCKSRHRRGSDRSHREYRSGRGDCQGYRRDRVGR